MVPEPEFDVRVKQTKSTETQLAKRQSQPVAQIRDDGYVNALSGPAGQEKYSNRG